LLVIDVDETSKNLEQVLVVCDAAKRFDLGRRDVLIALGGGVLSDTVRLAASLIRRGTPHLCVPTTLIGQIDAAIGIKGGVNFQGSKSYLGCFHPPEAVFIDSSLLASLPRPALSDGFAEALKLALGYDRDLFELIADHGRDLVHSGFQTPAPSRDFLLGRCIALTLQGLQEDLWEVGTLRRTLDFGHSFSPLIEARSGFVVSHGQAVAIDIALSACIACELLLLYPEDLTRILDTLTQIGLPVGWAGVDEDLMEASIVAAASHRAGSPNLVVPAGIGRTAFLNGAILDRRLFAGALTRFRAVTASRAALASPHATNWPSPLHLVR
jgi:2-epi-5-epi-valiolone synthase